MANTHELISSVAVGSGGAATISFTSIPSTYADLLLLLSARCTNPGGTDNGLLTFNGLTSNFNYIRFYGDGSNTASSSGAANNINYLINGAGATANTFSSTYFYIANYSSTSVTKPWYIDSVQESNDTGAYSYLTAGHWNDTAAINSITLEPRTTGSAYPFVQYTTAYLYGIKNS